MVCDWPLVLTRSHSQAPSDDQIASNPQNAKSCALEPVGLLKRMHGPFRSKSAAHIIGAPILLKFVPPPSPERYSGCPEL